MYNRADSKLGTNFGKKVDLNDSKVRDFIHLPGFYPILARKIIDNAPYQKIEDVLNIPDLTEAQRAKLDANFGEFMITTWSDDVLN